MVAKLLFPIMLIAMVVLGGVGADFLRNKKAHGAHAEAAGEHGAKDAGDKKDDGHAKKKKKDKKDDGHGKKAEKDDGHGKKKKKAKKDDGHGKKAEKDDGHGGGGDTTAVSFLNFKRQFVIPVVKAKKIESLVLINLNLELNEEAPEDVYLLEPKLRDALMRELLALSNKGAFSGDLTDVDTYDILRETLSNAVAEIIPIGFESVLILDLTRQDQ